VLGSGYVSTGGIYGGNPEAFNLTVEDFLPEVYLLPTGMSTDHDNQVILDARGAEEGQAYIDATHRLDGHIKLFSIEDGTLLLPQRVRSTIIYYDDAAGAEIAFGAPWNPDFVKEDAIFLDEVETNLGDQSYTVVYRDEFAPNRVLVKYEIVFIYKNVMAITTAWGYEEDVQHEFMLALAQTVFTRLQSASVR
ncbi:MAG: hypothetical protein N2D54_10375, partial [Chloroflexota bacterium]